MINGGTTIPGDPFLILPYPTDPVSLFKLKIHGIWENGEAIYKFDLRNLGYWDLLSARKVLLTVNNKIS